MISGWIQGIGWVAQAGCGAGRSTSLVPRWDAAVTPPTRAQVFEQPDLRFGRLDDFSRVGLAAIAFALRDAGWEAWQHKRPVGIVASTVNGCLATDLAYLKTWRESAGKLASPNLFAYTLPNCFLGEAALRFGLTGNSLVLNRHGGDDLEVVRQALEELSWNGQPGVLCGFCELPPGGIGTEDIDAGGLFLLMTAEPQSHPSPYGRLDLQKERLLFNDAVVFDLKNLVGACLEARI